LGQTIPFERRNKNAASGYLVPIHKWLFSPIFARLELDENNSCPSRNRQIWSRSRRAENLTAGIWSIFRGLNFPRNADIGQIGHLWMGTNSFLDGRYRSFPLVRNPLA
jgi:hypothetical protein